MKNTLTSVHVYREVKLLALQNNKAEQAEPDARHGHIDTGPHTKIIVVLWIPLLCYISI